jgi:DNA-binding transcriptional LysR family regulator
MIDSIDPDDLRRVDLNLIPVFATLLQERSTTRAAERLHLGQPAVSAALTRLRHTFGDPLFTRVPRGLEPTPRALALAAQLGPALAAIRQALRPAQAFDPAQAKVTLRLGMPDNQEHAVMPELLARLQGEAPHMRIVVRQTASDSAARLLDEQQIDLACGRIDKVAAWQRRQALAPVNYLCLYDRRLLPQLKPLTLARFLAVPHLLVSPRGDFSGVVDEALAKLGKTRRVIYATPHFASVPAVLRRVAAIATLPSHAALRFAKVYRLEIAEPPVELPGYQTSLAWLARYDEDPLHCWLRALITTTVRSISL